jgi:hypothetical protein
MIVQIGRQVIHACGIRCNSLFTSINENLSVAREVQTRCTASTVLAYPRVTPWFHGHLSQVSINFARG